MRQPNEEIRKIALEKYRGTYQESLGYCRGCFFSLLVASSHLIKQHEEDSFYLIVQRDHWIHPGPWQSEQETDAHIAAEGRKLRLQLEADVTFKVYSTPTG